VQDAARSQPLRTPVASPPTRIRVLDFLALVNWLDGSPILPTIEPYRAKILSDVLDTYDDDGRVRYNLALLGRGKKNSKTLDLCLAAIFSWRKACARAGVAGTTFHDLRRSAVRNFDDAGVSETVGMKLSGHKTPSVYRRYRITNTGDLRKALAKVEAASSHAAPSKIVPLSRAQ
jgi:hypothetical protein